MVDQTSQFYAILTNVGAAKQANADALGIPWTITQMAVGDGNPSGVDNPPLPMPTAAWTSLLNEWRRAPLNQLKVDEKNNAVIVAEQVIPADVGGRWIREIALYDADGDMVAVANCAPTFKPLLSQGSGRTQVVRLNLIVSSSSNVQLKIDPSVVLATREWVTEELAKQDFKHSVLAATTDPITLNGLQTIDGVVLPAGSRVLVKNQAAAKDNGLYQVVAGGPWTRCADADTSAKVTPGLLVMVERGTVNSDTAWQLLTDATIALGVTGLTFGLAFGRTGIAAGTYRSVTVDIYGRVVAATNPTTSAGYGLTDVYTKTQVDQALALKANLASPALSGVPTAPTPAAGTNTNQLATSAFVQSALAALVGSSPAALDTLNELAAALGNDPNFAATMTNALAGKVNLADKATQPIAEGGADNAKWMTALGVLQSILKQLNNLGLAINSAPTLATFEAITPGGLYRAFGGGAAGSVTPGGPPTSAASLIAVLVITPRSDVTYYLAMEHGTNSAARKIWWGQYWAASAPPTMFWSYALTSDNIATQAQLDAGSGDNLLVTTKTLRNGVIVSPGVNGFEIHPKWLGGAVKQWGRVTLTKDDQYVAFPMEFPNTCRSLQVSVVDVNERMTGFNNPTKNGFVAQGFRWAGMTADGNSFVKLDLAGKSLEIMWFAEGD